MRIAILTLPLHTNYGGILQAYALQTVLENMGHEVKVLCPPKRQRIHSPIVMPLVYVKRFIQKYLLGKDVAVRYDAFQRPRQHTDKFIRKYIHELCVTEWSSLYDQFDAYVVGSDQIWRKEYASWFPGIENAFLAFAEDWDIMRIAYSTSFGIDELEYSGEEIETCSHLLKNFDAISVREESAVQICEKKLGTSVIHLIDPTMLLSGKDYKKLYKRKRTKPNDGSLMCYILDENDVKEEITRQVSKRLGLKPFNGCSKVEDPNAEPKERIQPPVEQWLRAFNDAEFILTDSFHACVFSILFHKQFAVIPNVKRGNSRIVSLLKTFNLESRVINELKDIESLSAIDFSGIEQILECQRNKANNFLQLNQYA